MLTFLPKSFKIELIKNKSSGRGENPHRQYSLRPAWQLIW
nr:MAG TPA: INTERFERON REGULATORY FACTOR 2/DNA COMPLEX FACTOR, IFN INDUCTION, IRF.2A [Herelleviridae sp.]